EVDARLGELPAEDLVLDVVEADRLPAGDVAPALEEAAVAGLPYGRDRVLVEDRVERERVVRVQPVGEPVAVARKGLGRRVRAHARELVDEPVEERATLAERVVVDLAVRRDDGGEERRPGVGPERRDVHARAIFRRPTAQRNPRTRRATSWPAQALMSRTAAGASTVEHAR